MACHSGRYDDAAELVTAQSLRDYLPARQLANDLAEIMAERAGNRFAQGDSLGGWHDLVKAHRLGGASEAVQKLQQQYATRTLDEAKRYLAAAEWRSAIAQLEKLHKRGLADERARLVGQVARIASDATEAAAHGRFAEAAARMSKAAALAKMQSTGDSTMVEIAAGMEEQGERWQRQTDDAQRLSADMHAAVAAQNWGAALAAADGLLAIAPRHAAAAQTRRRAWRAVGLDVTQEYKARRPAGMVSLAIDKFAGRGGGRSTRHSSRSSEVDTVAGKEPLQRALLWVDAVGGFLVCLDDSIVLGQPSPGEQLSVPILADLSRRHAIIRRDGGAYIIEPLQRTSVDGREIREAHVLADNELIQLGDNVRLRFTKPHALSATARLTLESHHKTQPSSDAILLMADSCVLGAGRHCHVRCRDWQNDVVIYRNEGKLFCRASEPLKIDGEPASAGGATEFQSGLRIEGEEFAFTWETLV